MSFKEILNLFRQGKASAKKHIKKSDRNYLVESIRLNIENDETVSSYLKR
jgi:hypothetical protein